MIRKFSTVIVVLALFCSLGVHASFARSSSAPDNKTKPAEPATEALDPAKTAPASTGQPNEQLRAGIHKLVNDAKAGKVMLPAKSQIQPAKSNGWSKGTKLAVGVGVAVAVVVAILVVKHEKDNFLNGLRIF
jgi:hypothetical protein